ncbi:lipoprotein [Proteus vulgaris]|uniref:YfiM family lipoprotein n=1 Tax=Proteus vulgaris TaxID=585 RepID=UPI000E023694|nr:YfiM family lipoprotein [Proteus vulgaris]SUC24958.1 lipoprotein [Proteus vulgaris]
MKLKLKYDSVIILFSIIALTGCQSFHFANDNWRGKDKAQHFLFSMVASAGANAYADHQNYGYKEGVLIGLSFSISLGAAKELYDSRPEGTGWSWHDFAYDVAGAAAGTLLYQQVK